MAEVVDEIEPPETQASLPVRAGLLYEDQWTSPYIAFELKEDLQGADFTFWIPEDDARELALTVRLDANYLSTFGPIPAGELVTFSFDHEDKQKSSISFSCSSAFSPGRGDVRSLGAKLVKVEAK
jgi:hypothetical protein